MVVLFVLGIFANKVSNGIRISPRTQVKADITAITTQLRTYELFCQHLPTTEQGLKALVEKPTVPPIPIRWEQLLKEIPKDPWGRPYQYRLHENETPMTFDVLSPGPDGIPSADDIHLEK